jgi:hypothetical protein
MKRNLMIYDFRQFILCVVAILGYYTLAIIWLVDSGTQIMLELGYIDVGKHLAICCIPAHCLLPYLFWLLIRIISEKWY